jgi:Amt family ammonium transporter
MQWRKSVLIRGSVQLLGTLFLLGVAAAVGAQEEATAPPAIDTSKVAMDTMWTLITAFLVFFMNLGFAMVESGFCRAKNATNILAKNYIVFAVSSVAFLLTGFGLMFSSGNGFIGTSGVWFVAGADNSPLTGDAYQGVYSALNWTGTPLWAKFFFQLVFAGTAATIVSGAVAERIKFGSFFLFSFIMVGLIYPITGHWIWGGGWLAQRGMLDFAGSTVVHSVGGWAALAGAVMLGPRIGRYQDGKPVAIPGHSLTSATLGVFVLWFGWFGFNPGSTMAADWASIAHIATTTNTAAATASISALLCAWVILGKPDLGMTLNGGLAGLVAITCPCAFVSVGSAFFIGIVAGILVVLSVLFFDRIKVDDPVGAVSVHMTNGVWGTLSLGLFADPSVCPAASVTKLGLFLGGGPEQFQAQLIGAVAVGAFVFAASIVGWSVINGIVGLRVSPEEEFEGLDIGEHGNPAYPDFVLATAGHLVSSAEVRIPRELRREIGAASPVRSVSPAEVGVPREARPAPAPTPTSIRQPPVLVRQPERRRTPPVRLVETRGSSAVSSSSEEHAFEISVLDVDKKVLRQIWHDLCEKYPHDVPREFNDIYQDVKSFRDNTWAFRQGNPEEYRRKLEQILYLYGIEGAHMQVA